STRVTDDDRTMDSTVVPVTLSDGRTAELIVPRRPSAGHRVYLREDGQLYPIALENPAVSREEFIRSQPRIVEHRVIEQPGRTVTVQAKKKRSLAKQLLIVGGSGGAGAAIGAIA